MCRSNALKNNSARRYNIPYASAYVLIPFTTSDQPRSLEKSRNYFVISQKFVKIERQKVCKSPKNTKFNAYFG